MNGSKGGFVHHDGKGLEFERYPGHQKFALNWTQVEKYIDLMIQSGRYLTDEERKQRTAAQEATIYKVGDEVVVDLSTRTIEGTIGYVGETDVRIDTSAHGHSWDNEVINKPQFEDALRQEEPDTRTIEGTIGYVGETDVRIDTSAHGHSWDNEVINKPQFEDALRQEEPELSDEELDELPVSVVIDGKIQTFPDAAALDEALDTESVPEPAGNFHITDSDEELDELPVSVVIDGKIQTFPDAAALDEALDTESVPEPAGNFHITDDRLGEGGSKQKYTRNVEAIRTLFRLEQEHRAATAEEQQVLSQYVGWGGLPDVFDPDKDNWATEEAIRTLFRLEQEHRAATAEEQQVLSQYVGWGGLPDVFDPDKDNWATEYAELKGLLSEGEYAAARASTLNAHYTSPVVIRSIYDAVEKMGFQSGNILEPSMGVGNFFGMLPEGMQSSRLYGVELDSITGRIAQKLYPQADITVAGFDTTDR